jgi:hypothetical protein
MLPAHRLARKPWRELGLSPNKCWIKLKNFPRPAWQNINDWLGIRNMISMPSTWFLQVVWKSWRSIPLLYPGRQLLYGVILFGFWTK